ncbi:MAG: NAD(P)/FAD-dependent oxidoreductase, partial [Burkholderiaceae bacterium]
LGGVQWRMPASVHRVSKRRAQQLDCFMLETSAGEMLVKQLVIATGGLSIPKIGATDFAYRIAKQFGIPLVEPRPGLVPLTFDAKGWSPYVPMAGIALEVEIEAGDRKSRGQFREDLLFTHRGLSGPAVLQISNYWREGMAISLNVLPELDVGRVLVEQKSAIRKAIGNWLSQYLPTRLADAWTRQSPDWQRPIAEASDKALHLLAERLSRWEITPTGSEGYRKAEVTLGGVDTRALSQQSMMVQAVPGLYFVGEAVDVTGWLGGYNFQWAWASGVAAGLSV